MSALPPLGPDARARLVPLDPRRLHELRRAAAEASRAAERVLGPIGLDLDEHALLADVARGDSGEGPPAVVFRLLLRGHLARVVADGRLQLTGRGGALLREADARLDAATSG